MSLQSCIRLVQFLFRIFKHVSEHRTGREVMPTKCIQRRCGLLIHTGTRSYSGASHLICIPSFRPNSVTFFTGCERGELLRDDVSDVPTVLHHSGLLQLPHADVHRICLVRDELYKNRSSRKIHSRRLFSKRIWLPEDLFSYWEPVFREDLFLYHCLQSARASHSGSAPTPRARSRGPGADRQSLRSWRKCERVPSRQSF